MSSETLFFLHSPKKWVNPHGSQFFFPFAVQMVATEKTFVTTLNHCSGRLVTESGERSMGSNLVTESGTPRTSTCRKSGIVCVRFDELRKYERHDFLWRVFSRDLRQEQYHWRICITNLALPQRPMEVQCEGANGGHSRHKTNIENQHSPTQSLRRQSVSMNSIKQTEYTWREWTWVTHESCVWISTSMKSDKLKPSFRFALIISIYLEAHPRISGTRTTRTLSRNFKASAAKRIWSYLALQAERYQGVTSCDLLIVKKTRGYWKSKSTYRKGRVKHSWKEEF